MARRRKKNNYKSDFEGNFHKRLSKSREGIKVDYEVDTIPYVIKRNYNPDFRVKWLRNGVYQTTFIETKGYFSPEDRQKMRLVKEQHPELDIRMVFLSDNKLNKRSKSRYSDWCTKNGIPYAINTIPKDWFV